MTQINYEAMEREQTYVPENLRGGIQRWIDLGIRPGDCLCAFLTNNLVGVVNRADPSITPHIASIVRWLACYAPMGCWGSEARMDEWKQQLNKAAAESA